MPDQISSLAHAFLLMKSGIRAGDAARALAEEPWIRWAAAAYGPHPVTAYAEARSHRELTDKIEDLRTAGFLLDLDARMCKHIPGDDDLPPLRISQPHVAVLLVNVNYGVEKERDVTYNLRRLPAVCLARAMWGPTDIVAIVEAADHETMRNLICDHIKVMRGVASNTTLYCYPSRE